MVTPMMVDFGELAGEGAEVLGEPDEGSQPHRLLGRDRRHVEGVGDRAVDQIVRHLLGDLERDVLLRLGGGGAEMRRADDVREAEERARLGRLGDEDVDAGAGDLAGLDRRGERLLVDQAAAGAIDDADAVLHLGDRRRVDDVLRLLGERRVQRDEIGAAEELVELDLVDAELHGALFRQVRDRRR